MCITEHHEALLAEGAAKRGKREDHVIVGQVLQRPLHPDEVVRVGVGREFFEPLVEEGAPGKKEKNNLVSRWLRQEQVPVTCRTCC